MVDVDLMPDTAIGGVVSGLELLDELIELVVEVDDLECELEDKLDEDVIDELENAELCVEEDAFEELVLTDELDKD